MGAWHVAGAVSVRLSGAGGAPRPIGRRIAGGRPVGVGVGADKPHRRRVSARLVGMRVRADYLARCRRRGARPPRAPPLPWRGARAIPPRLCAVFGFVSPPPRLTGGAGGAPHARPEYGRYLIVRGRPCVRVCTDSGLHATGRPAPEAGTVANLWEGEAPRRFGSALRQGSCRRSGQIACLAAGRDSGGRLQAAQDAGGGRHCGQLAWWLPLRRRSRGVPGQAAPRAWRPLPSTIISP